MAKFYVGQRVRILWSVAWPELAGQEGRVVGFRKPGPLCGELDVAPDCWCSEFSPYPDADGLFNSFAPSGYQVEPIIPEGQQPSEYSFEQLMDNLLKEGVMV